MWRIKSSFIEESGAAQYYRDVRVTAIYEGTNGIQAMDLVGRKLMDGGEAAYSLVDDIQKTVKTCPEDFSPIANEPFSSISEFNRSNTEGLHKLASLKTIQSPC